VKLLVDNSVSPEVARGLRTLGHDAVHVGDLGMSDATDRAIFGRAFDQERVLLSADTDFAAILARGGARRPSCMLFRHGAERRPSSQVRLLREILPRIADALAKGAIVTVEPTRVRIRALPVPR
jgi:predicted nuclease of predicted toxin-antitoxin system